MQTSAEIYVPLVAGTCKKIRLALAFASKKSKGKQVTTDHGTNLSRCFKPPPGAPIKVSF
jgi:hypothetical protein